MGIASFKALIRAVSYVIGVVALSGCIMEPINLTKFVEDEEVTEIVDRGSGSVKLTLDSDKELTAGNKRITGLDPKKYYRVEEWNENRISSREFQFVSSNGTRSRNLTGIGRVSPEKPEITGLTNSYYYRVKAAIPLEGDVFYYNLSDIMGGGSPSQKKVTINEGVITIPPPKGGYLVFTPPPQVVEQLQTTIDDYDIVKVPVTPAGPTTHVSFIYSGDILLEAAEGTEVDYVFLYRGPLEKELYVLKIIFAEPPEPEDLTIKVTLSLTVDNSPVVNSSSNFWYNQSDDKTITFTVAGNYTEIKWYIDGELVSSGASFILHTSEIKYKIIGIYTITVEAKRGDMPYSTAFEVEVR